MIATSPAAGTAWYAEDTGMLYVRRSNGTWPGPSEGAYIQGQPGPAGARGPAGAPGI